MFNINCIRIWIISIFVTSELCNGEDELLDVIIIGGGAAGIRAAARLQEHGITNIKIIERTDRLGGVLRSGQIGGYTVELGTGRVWDIDTEIKELADQYISTVSYPWREIGVYNDSGSDITQEVLEAMDHYDTLSQPVNEYAETIRIQNYPDISVVNAYRWKGFSGESPIGRMVNFFKYSVKDDPELESLKYRVGRSGPINVVKQDGDGFAKLIVEYGQQNIMDLDEKLELSTTVTGITRRQDSVTVHTDDDHFEAKHVIVAYTLGELQHQAMIFEPQLPDWKLHAIHGYAVIRSMKIYLRFPANEAWFISDEFWRIGHVSERNNYYMFWQNFDQFHAGSHIVLGIVKNDQIMQLQRMTDEEIMEEAVGVLRKMFGDAVPDAEEILVPRGNDLPPLYGGYSYWPAGYTMAQHAALKAAVGQVHFAGDYYRGGVETFTQADWTAGRMVADNVHSCMDETTAKLDICGNFRPSYMTRGCTYDLALNFDPMAMEDDGSCQLVGMAPSSSAWDVKASSDVMLIVLVMSLGF